MSKRHNKTSGACAEPSSEGPASCEDRLEEAESSLVLARKSEKALLEQNRELTEKLVQLTESQDELIQRERLDALGHMSSGVVHDFNNTLTPILGASDFLIANPHMLENRTDTLSLLDSMRTAARDGRKMIKRLRSFYKPEDDVEISDVDVNQVIEHVVLITQPKWGQAQAHGQCVTMNTDLEAVPCVVMNEAQLRDVLTNFVLNALEAMPEEGGEITLRTRSVAGAVVIEVIDTGRGMSEEMRKHCFEPFCSTKGSDGAGMGLSIAHGMTKKYHGDIDVESEEGKGTTVRIALHASDAAVGKVEIVSGPHPVHLLNILVVDDNLPLRDVMSACLAADGHEVQSAGGGEEALQKCAKHKFDVILLDVVMPGISGLDLVSQLKGIDANMNIIFITGSVDCFEDGQKPDGVDIVLNKPVNQADLRRVIAKVMVHKI